MKNKQNVRLIGFLRERILEEHNEKFREMNEELDQQREKSAGALKLAYLLRLEIAKQKALIGKVFLKKKYCIH